MEIIKNGRLIQLAQRLILYIEEISRITQSLQQTFLNKHLAINKLTRHTTRTITGPMETNPGTQTLYKIAGTGRRFPATGATSTGTLTLRYVCMVVMLVV